MDNLWILPIAAFILLDISAIYVVINEDILYEPSQRFWKVIFILLVPFIGAIRELYLLSKYAHYRATGSGDDARWYAFWDHYAPTPSSSDGSSSSFGFDGGGDGGGGGGD